MSILKFKSKAAAEIVMLRPNAETLLKIIGTEAGERGVIEASDTSRAIAQLVAAINHERMGNEGKPEIDVTDLSPEERRALANHVSLEQRAYPLLKMLEAAHKKNVDVHWGF